MPATPLARVFDFTAGTIIASQQVDDEFNQLVTRINKVLRNLSFNTSVVGNVGAAGPDDLHTYSIVAGTLANPGDRIVFEFMGFGANNANAKQPRISFGGVAIGFLNLTTGSARTWRYKGSFMRLTSTTVRGIFEMIEQNTGNTTLTQANITDNDFTVPNLDSNATVIKVEVAVSTADNDVTQNYSTVDFIGA